MNFVIYMIIVIITLIMWFVVEKIDKKRKYELIMEVSYGKKYIDIIHYKNKDYKFELIHDNMTPKHFSTYNKLDSYTLFINDKPVVSVWVINTLIKTIKIIQNNKYNANNLYEILKAYKKEYNKKWNDEFNKDYAEKYNQPI